MQHRHLNHSSLSLAPIADLIARGGRDDWSRLRLAVLESPEVAEAVRRICRPKVSDPYAQRYIFWMADVDERTA